MNLLYHFGVWPDEMGRLHEHELKALESSIEKMKKDAKP